MVLNVLRIIFASIVILFLPGFVWSLVFFKKEKIDLIERIALSFGLSIALVPLTVLFLSLLSKFETNLIHTSLVVGALILIPLLFIQVKKLLENLFLAKHGSKSNEH